MSGLRSKLERRKGGSRFPRQGVGNRAGESSGPDLVDKLRQRMERIAPRRAAAADQERESDSGRRRQVLSAREVAHVLAGEPVESGTGAGAVRFLHEYSPDFRHGRFALGQLPPEVRWVGALARDERLVGFRPFDALYLDTETTGLSRGTGTFPFLIGMGWFEPHKGFVVEQLLCVEPAAEPGVLDLVGERLKGATGLVTFNGRAFDLPLLNTRFVLAGKANPGYDLPHLDLLYVCRRVFGRRLKSRSLASLEEAVLGCQRVGDIPGQEIPGIYTSFLRGGPAEPLAPVLEHNALDLVALVALGVALEQMYTDPAAVEHAADRLALVEAALATGDQEAAEAHLVRVGGEEPEQWMIFATFARDAARRGDLDRSRALWFEALQSSPHEPAVHLALAKHLEHRDKDFAQALVHARHTESLEGEEGTQHRVARLERRLTRQRAANREEEQ